MDKIVCIIPARGGSKRIPMKNIVDLGGKPLIKWTLDDAKDSKYIDRIIVSTDDKEIKEVCLKEDVEVFDRKPELATDMTESEDVIIDVLDKLKEENYEPTYVVFLQCTTPFRGKGDIDGGIEYIRDNKLDSMLFGVEFDKFIWNRKPLFSINYHYWHRERTQDKELEIIETGNYISKPFVYYRYKNRLGGDIGCYEVSKKWELDLDTEEDLKLARKMIE